MKLCASRAALQTKTTAQTAIIPRRMTSLIISCVVYFFFGGFGAISSGVRFSSESINGFDSTVDSHIGSAGSVAGVLFRLKKF